MEEKKKTNPKRLVIDIPLELHTEIKQRAALRLMPIRVWVARIIMEAIKKEKQYE